LTKAKSSPDGPSITLIFPPFCATPVPHLGIANLVAYERSEGIRCDAFDLNIRFLEWLTRDGGHLDSNVRRHAERYRALQHRRSLDSEQLADLRQTVRALSHTPSHLSGPNGGPEIASPSGSLDRWMEDEKIHFNHHARACMGPAPATVEEALTAGVDSGAAETLSAFIRHEETRKVLVRASRSDIVGINVSFAEQLLGARLVSRALRSMAPAVFIVWGGTQITLLRPADHVRLIRHPGIDALCVFEGEAPLRELARRVEANRPIRDVPNLITADDDGSPHFSHVTAPIPMSEVPTPFFDDEELARYPRETLALPVFVSRGCYWGRCTYCDYRRSTSTDRGYEVRPPELVADDVQRLQARHAGVAFSLITDALPPTWSRRFAECVSERCVQAAFWAYVRAEPQEVWSQDLLRALAAAGVRAVTCGAEATVDRVLGVMDKGTSVADINDNLEMFHATGISVTLNLIPDFPTVTLAEARAGLAYVADHRDLIRHLNYQPFELSCHAPICEDPSAYGLEVDRDAIVGTARGAHYCSFDRIIGLDNDERNAVLDAYEELRLQLEQHHDTMAVRAAIGASDFHWRDASFLFRRSIVLRSAFSLRKGGEPGDVFFILNPLHQRFLEIDASFAEFVAAVTTPRVPASFDRLCTLVRQGEESPLVPGELEHLTVAYVGQLLENGLIEGVIGGAANVPGQPEAHRR